MREIIIKYAFDENPATVVLSQDEQSATYQIMPEDIADILHRLAGDRTATNSPASMLVRCGDMIAASTLGGCRVARRFPERVMTIRFARGSEDARDVTGLIIPPVWWILDYTPDGNISMVKLAVEHEGKVSAWPYGNVHEGGTICWGNYNTAQRRGTPDDIDTFFFGLPFNTDIPADRVANDMLQRSGADLKTWYAGGWTGTATIEQVVKGEQMLVRPVVRRDETPRVEPPPPLDVRQSPPLEWHTIPTLPVLVPIVFDEAVPGGVRHHMDHIELREGDDINERLRDFRTTRPTATNIRLAYPQPDALPDELRTGGPVRPAVPGGGAPLGGRGDQADGGDHQPRRRE